MRRGVFRGRCRAPVPEDAESFASVHGIRLYVPEFRLRNFRFPLIACELGCFDNRHISWAGDHENGCIFNDAKSIMQLHGVKPYQIFSTCKQYIFADDSAGQRAAKEAAHIEQLRKGDYLGLRTGLGAVVPANPVKAPRSLQGGAKNIGQAPRPRVATPKAFGVGSPQARNPRR